ncbi:MAG: acetylglutamate kinase [Acidobacteriota bacterium]
MSHRTNEHDRHVAIAALRAAEPYLRLFQGKTFVIKAGGAVVADRRRTCALMEQVGLLHRLGIRVVVVHGGGSQATELAGRLGLETRFVEGRRVTDEAMRDVATMTLNGTVNTQIVAVCRQLGVPALGLSGVDGGLIQARRRPPIELEGEGLVDYGHVGDIESIDASVLERLLADRFVPILSPLSADEEGHVLNVNADVVASQLAKAMRAEKLILLTGATGILEDLDDPTSLIPYTDLRGLDALHEAGALADGMLPKVTAIRAALAGGVPRVHVISWEVRDSLLLEVFTNEGSGTLVVADTRTEPRVPQP